MIDELIKYIKDKKRVCPKHDAWNILWEMLPDKVRVGNGWEPSLPLILAAWWETTDREKQNRLIEHINYASEKGMLDKIDQYLRALSEDQWVCEGEA